MTSDAEEEPFNALQQRKLSDNEPTDVTHLSSYEHRAIIDRMGENLRLFNRSDNRMNAEWIETKMIEMMNDCAFMKTETADNVELEFDLYSYIIQTYFNGIECDFDTCKSLKMNNRNRMNVINDDNNNHHSNEFEEQSQSRNVFALDSIHCSLLHGYNTGYKLYRNERMELQMLQTENGDESKMDEIEEHEVDLFLDQTYDRLQSILNKSRHRRQPQTENENESSKVQKNSKFVTVVDIHVGNENNNHNNNNEEEDAKDHENETRNPSKRKIFYRFGYKFYYWPLFENGEEIDVHYNNGKYPYSYWYIAQKYDSLKEELLKHITLHSYEEQYANALPWMETKYLKNMLCIAEKGMDYGIERNSPITIPVILALFFHCNFTELCTLFSRSFRKLFEAETDEELKGRNAEFREFSRLLVECVHAFGTRLVYSKIKLFYHGVSIIMQFPSTFAQFCSPTSTTTAFMVAMNFGKEGMVLELINNKTSYLSYFDCSILSDFSNENERLFIQGGFSHQLSSPQYTGLTFNSIRILALKHNYNVFVVAICCLQQLLQNSGQDNTLKLKGKHVKCISLLIDWKLNAIMNSTQTQTQNNNNKNNSDSDNNNNNSGTKQKKSPLPIPMYVCDMFDRLLSTTESIDFCLEFLNVGVFRSGSQNTTHHFVLFRPLFCELYSTETLSANEKKWGKQWIVNVYDWDQEFHGHPIGFVQPIYALKFDLFYQLFPNLKSLAISNLPLSYQLMDYIFHLRVWRTTNTTRGQRNIEIMVKFDDDLYENQSDYFGLNGKCGCCCGCFVSLYGCLTNCCAYQCQCCLEKWQKKDKIRVKRYNDCKSCFAAKFAEIGVEMHTRLEGQALVFSQLQVT